MKKFILMFCVLLVAVMLLNAQQSDFPRFTILSHSFRFSPFPYFGIFLGSFLLLAALWLLSLPLWSFSVLFFQDLDLQQVGDHLKGVFRGNDIRGPTAHRPCPSIAGL
jgi:hypothetical protein